MQLLRRARKGTLEVEDLLRAARTPSLELFDEIDGLIAELGWTECQAYPDVPWFQWATVVKTFCRNGFPGVAQLGEDPGYLTFVTGLLEELVDSRAVKAVIELLPCYPVSTTTSQAKALVEALNLLGMRLKNLDVSESDENKARQYIHGFLSSRKTDAERATALYALRYFGDQTSLSEINQVPLMSDHWEPARAAATRAIKRRRRDRQLLDAARPT